MLGELQPRTDLQPCPSPLKIIPAVIEPQESANYDHVVKGEKDINLAAAENMPANFCVSPLDDNSYVEYGPIVNGQRTWVRAKITPALLHSGTPAVYDFPFFSYRYGLTLGRGHLLASLFGGNGKEPRNVIPLPYHSASLPLLEDIEQKILVCLSGGIVANILIKVTYDQHASASSVLLPRSLVYIAKNLRGKSIIGDFNQGCVLLIK